MQNRPMEKPQRNSMKRGFAFQVCLLIIFFTQSLGLLFASEKELEITMIYTEGGGGHKSAQEALEKVLIQEKPEGINLNIRKIDPPMATCAGRLATQFWDTCFEGSHYDLLEMGLIGKTVLENGILPVVQAVDKFSRFGDLRRTAQLDILPMEDLIMRKGRPDMLISMINSGNEHFLEVAKKHKIPFRILCTDYKIDSFIDGIGSFGSNYDREQLEVYVPSSQNEVIRPLLARNIPYRMTGYPVSPEFNSLAGNLRSRDPETLASMEALLNRFQVSPGDSVLFVMMGAKGFDLNATIQYIQAIRRNAYQLHQPGKRLQLFVAAGRNEKLRYFARNLALSNNDDIAVHGLENLTSAEVAAFMGIYQLGYPYLMFTKPGGSTVGQAEAMGTPVLYSLNPISHERFNADVMKRQNYSEVIDMAYRAHTLHPQKIVEVSAQAMDQGKNYLASFWPLSGLSWGGGGFLGNALGQGFHRVSEPIVSAVNSAEGTIAQALPQEVRNQDLVDDKALISILRKYLVEGQRFSVPPSNLFGKNIAPLIYSDLKKSREGVRN